MKFHLTWFDRMVGGRRKEEEARGRKGAQVFGPWDPFYSLNCALLTR
jgi:hypothetical protein